MTSALGQRKTHSFLEACISTTIGFIVAFCANLIILPAFGYTPSFGENIILTCFYTVVSIIRGYFVRRLFNWLHVKELL